MKILLYVLLIFITAGAKAQETFSISGIVKNERSEVVSGAVVFITSSKHIVVTDREGKFTFNNISPGSYEVVVKMLGSTPATQAVNVHDRSVNLTFSLQGSNTLLNEVTISGGPPDPKVKDYLDVFTRFFLGETVNAEKCKIVNPQVLQYHHDKATDILMVSADEFIEVENKGLGYKIKYLLKQFMLDKRNNICVISGSPYFEEMKGTEAEQKKWAVNRREAYLSSSRHFFKAVINNTARAEGYQVYQIINDPKLIKDLSERSPDEIIKYQDYIGRNGPEKRYAMRISNINSLFVDDNRNFKTLKNTGMLGLFVINTRQDQSPLYYRTGLPIELPIESIPAKVRRNMQIALITPVLDTVTIDRNYEWPAKGFMYSAYWSWLKIADLTPLDYFVEPEPEKKK